MAQEVRVRGDIVRENKPTPLRQHAAGEGADAAAAPAASDGGHARVSGCPAPRLRSFGRARAAVHASRLLLLEVMTAILGGGMASRFFSDLRDTQALAYSTGVRYSPRVDTSAFVAILGTASANVPKAEDALVGDEFVTARRGTASGQAVSRRAANDHRPAAMIRVTFDRERVRDKGGSGMRTVRTAFLTFVIVMSIPIAVDAQTVGEVFRKVTPSVVVIRARGREVSAAGQTRFTETGSGVLISPDGKVMTAAHVVHAMDEINVEFLGGETVSAKVIQSEPAADLSLLQLERVPSGARVATMANSDLIQVGDPVIIVGAPYGLSYSLSNGLISARWAPNTVYPTMPLAEFFQTTATINTGNSGGPMFSMNGDVIGIVSHNISKSGGSEGLGFVVTLNTAKQLLLEKRSFWSGLEGQFLPDDVADLLNLPDNAAGYIVKSVAKGSPGEAMGLRGGTKVVVLDGREFVLGGDIVLQVQGVAATPANLSKLRELMSQQRTGDILKARVLRAGKILDLTWTVP